MSRYKKMHKDLLANLGKAIYTRRVNQGMSQTELSQESGIDRSSISEIENGKRNPSVGAVASLADCLKTSLPKLLCGCDDCIKGNGNHNGLEHDDIMFENTQPFETPRMAEAEKDIDHDEQHKSKKDVA